MTVTADQARDRGLDKVNPTSPKRRVGSKKVLLMVAELWRVWLLRGPREALSLTVGECAYASLGR